MENDKLVFLDESTGEEILFEIVDDMIVDGCKYILVVDEEDVATILKEVELEESEEYDYDCSEATYALVEDDAEFQKVTLLFMENDEYDMEI